MYWVGRISSIGFGVDYNCYFLFGSDSTYDWHANYYSPTYTMLLTEYASSGIYNASPVSLYTGDSNAVLNTTFSNVYYPTAPSVSILSVAGLTGLTRYQGICYDRNAHCGWCGDLAEVIVFSNALTTPQHQQVESYLAQKWGMRQQLPQGHPGTRGIVFPSDPVNVLVRVPYPSAFTPSVAGTVSMWLDGADPAGTGIKPSNGATVSTWVDKSGSGINLTAVGTPTYTLSNSSVYLDGNAYLQNTNFNFTNYTLFIVSVQTSDIGPLYTNNTTTAGYSGFFPIYYSSYYLVQSDGSWLTSTSAFSKGTTYIYSIQYDSLNNINVWSTGSISPVITGTAGTITRNKFLLGKRNVGGFQENMTGNVFEVVQYNSDLGQTARQQVEGYLAWKWGLQANLPANHPYKNASPNITNQFGISRPANVLPIPPITISARPRPSTYVTGGLLFFLDAGNAASYPGTGSTWTDLAGSGLTTTLFNSPTYSSANGGYLSFAPVSSQYGQTSASLASLSVWSVEVWHYYTATNGSGAPCILTEVWNSTPINFTLGNATGANTSLQAGYFNNAWYVTTGSYSLPSVGWYHIVGTYDGTNIKLYVNNVLTQTQASAVTPARSNLGIRFMRRWDLGDYWGGRLAIIRIYNRALLASEVTTNYSASKARFGLS
jgi:hypothetical protein